MPGRVIAALAAVFAVAFGLVVASSANDVRGPANEESVPRNLAKPAALAPDLSDVVPLPHLRRAPRPAATPAPVSAPAPAPVLVTNEAVVVRRPAPTATPAPQPPPAPPHPQAPPAPPAPEPAEKPAPVPETKFESYGEFDSSG
jgi:hypothetical protein